MRSQICALSVAGALFLLPACSSRQTDASEAEPEISQEALDTLPADTDAVPAEATAPSVEPSAFASDEPPPAAAAKRRRRAVSSRRKAPEPTPAPPLPVNELVPPSAVAQAEISPPTPDPTPVPPPAPPVSRPPPQSVTQASPEEPSAPFYWNRTFLAGVTGFFLCLSAYFIFRRKP